MWGWCWPRGLSTQGLVAVQSEAAAVHGFDGRLAACSGHLGADVPDMAVDGAIGDMDIAGIGGVEDQLAREHESRPCQHRFQNVEFERRQRNPLVVEGNAAPVR